MAGDKENLILFLHSSDIKYIEQLGSCMRIAAAESAYLKQSIRDGFNFFSCAVRQGRAGFFNKTSAEPFAFLIWAFFDPICGKMIHKSGALPRLHASEWNSGTNFFLLAFAAKKPEKYQLIRHLLNAEIVSIPRAFVRSKRRVRCYEPIGNSAKSDQDAMTAGACWRKMENDTNAQSSGCTAEEDFIFPWKELQKLGMSWSRPGTFMFSPEAALHNVQYLPRDFWIGVAVLIALHCPTTSTLSLEKFLGTIQEAIRHSRVSFYFTDNGQPEALVIREAMNGESPSQIMLLLAPKGLHARLRCAIRKDLALLPQPITYSRERRGRTRQLQFFLKDETDGVAMQEIE